MHRPINLATRVRMPIRCTVEEIGDESKGGRDLVSPPTSGKWQVASGSVWMHTCSGQSSSVGGGVEGSHS